MWFHNKSTIGQVTWFKLLCYVDLRQNPKSSRFHCSTFNFKRLDASRTGHVGHVTGIWHHWTKRERKRIVGCGPKYGPRPSLLFPATINPIFHCFILKTKSDHLSLSFPKQKACSLQELLTYKYWSWWRPISICALESQLYSLLHWLPIDCNSASSMQSTPKSDRLWRTPNLFCTLLASACRCTLESLAMILWRVWILGKPGGQWYPIIMLLNLTRF